MYLAQRGSLERDVKDASEREKTGREEVRLSLIRIRPEGLRGKNSTSAASCGNVPVQGPEICFPKHASCDFTQHCLAQQPAFCFLDISCEKRTNPEPLPLSFLRYLHRFFFLLRLFVFPFSVLVRACVFWLLSLFLLMWTFRTLGVWLKILGCLTLVLFLLLLKCQHGECVGRSGQARW